MIILYVPFPRNNAGDLAFGMSLWANNHAKHFGEKLQVIFYNDEIDYDKLSSPLSIYLCAHGSSETEMRLYNHRETKSSSSLSIQEAASRLSSDFHYVHYKIENIHLYCCGTKEKNHQLALLIQNNISYLQPHRIHYYQGSLTVANESGQLFSIMGTQELSIDEVKYEILKKEKPEKKEKDSSKFQQYYLQIRQPNRYAQLHRREQKMHHFLQEVKFNRQQHLFNQRQRPKNDAKSEVQDNNNLYMGRNS